VDGGRCRAGLAGGVPVVAAPAEVDVTNAAELGSALAEAAALGDGTLVVDMTLTRFCDSCGLHALLTARRRAVTGGGRLVVAAAAPAVLRIFAITGVDRLIPCFPTLTAALAHAAAAIGSQPEDHRAVAGAVAGPPPAASVPPDPGTPEPWPAPVPQPG
jgi:anti-sigma B factor antagonist